MQPEQFLEFARILPEPLLLLTSEGEVLAANRPVAVMLERSSKELLGKRLFELVIEPPDKILKYLQACSSSRQLVLGSLTFLIPDKEPLVCRSEGAVVQSWSPQSPVLNLLRLERRAFASRDFILLNQKINELTKEIQQRKQAQEALSCRNEELQQALKKLQDIQLQLVQAEKMSSLGQLVAGVAHELNNPVNFIQGNLKPAGEYIQNLLKLVQVYQQEYPDPNETIQEELEAIDFDFVKEDAACLLRSMQIGTERICEIVKSLRNFSRLDEAEVKEVDIHEGIESTLVILGSRFKAQPEYSGVEVIKEYGLLPLVHCYPGQLNQVFMNILSNALDALEERKGDLNSTPTIWIRTKMLGNDRVTIEIEDNGPGIEEKVRQQIFDPFFTTKPVGKGTGLGLSGRTHLNFRLPDMIF